ncbi:MAG: hypothetical protein QG650_1059 [Patescibacteria group bacterium]|nr:hypothetical protein [Patescibacteria group bacterium]
MLNFRKIYEFFFSSFRIAKDTELVSKLIDEGERYGLVIKRSWIYGAFALIWLVPIGIFAGFNVYLLGKHFEWSPLGYSIIALLVANLAYSAFVSGKYVYYFRKTYR